MLLNVDYPQHQEWQEVCMETSPISSKILQKLVILCCDLGSKRIKSEPVLTITSVGYFWSLKMFRKAGSLIVSQVPCDPVIPVPFSNSALKYLFHCAVKKEVTSWVINISTQCTAQQLQYIAMRADADASLPPSHPKHAHALQHM